MKIPPHLEKYLSPQTTRETRLLVAKGMIAMSPEELVTAFSILVGDSDSEVSETAKKGLEGIPAQTLLTALGRDLNPSVIRAIVHAHQKEEAILAMAALNPNTDDETISFLASHCTEGVADVIAENKEHFIRNPALLSALKANPSVSRTVLDNLESFLLSARGIEPKKIGRDLSTRIEKGLPSADEDLKREKGAVTEAERENFSRRIMRMTIGEKIKLALLGNKEAREILLKDTNRLVSSSVLKNPRITEEEILRAANSKTTSDDILRQMAGNREWVKKYPVKLGIVNNPKTPLSISMHFLPQLNEKDIRQIAKSKNVASVLATAAKKIIMLKEKR